MFVFHFLWLRTEINTNRSPVLTPTFKNFRSTTNSSLFDTSAQHSQNNADFFPKHITHVSIQFWKTCSFILYTLVWRQLQRNSFQVCKLL